MVSILYVFNQKLLNRILYSNPFRICWIIFFSLCTGFWLSAFAVADTHYRAYTSLYMVSFFSCGIVLFVNPPIREQKEMEVKEYKVHPLQPPKPIKRFGVIYIMRRNDGILKFGKTYNLRSRIGQHKTDYQANFYMLSSWVVPEIDDFESLALNMTKQYSYIEGNRRELRQMSDTELSNFILDFTNRVQKGFIL